MSSRTSTSPAAEPASAATISRNPQQGRSKASLERMLAAARQLMLERGNEEFTLQDVSQTGAVSIGSIYLRFESKDNLVRAVITSELGVIAEREDAMMAEVLSGAPGLAEFMRRFVDSYAELLREHAPALRLSMARAAYDPLVSAPGKASAIRIQTIAANAMLAYRDEFAGTNPERKASAAYQIIFATLARELSLGSTGESANRADWEELKAELAKMCLAYLRHAE